jgi:hypothetical protein
LEAFITTGTSKQGLIKGLVLAFEQQKIRILDDPQIIMELEAYEEQQLPSGIMRYSAPSGMTDDCVMALALSLHVIEGLPTVDIRGYKVQ